MWGFERGRVYSRRADIHQQFGGQQQGGIITPSKHSVVILITGEAGLAHGYADRLRDDGTFEYFGQGQEDDMKFLRGNKAIADHSKNGKSLLLFREVKQGLRFEGEMVCSGFHSEIAPDRKKNMRKAIVFELLPVESFQDLDIDVPKHEEDIVQLRDRAFAAINKTPGEERRQSGIFERSRIIAEYVIARAKGKCEGCLEPAPFHRPNGTPYLETHHIRRLSDGGPDDPHFVIALCPNCHRHVHHGADGGHYNAQLLARMKVIER